MDIGEIYNRFPTQKDCLRLLEEIRWASTPECPYCNSRRVTPAPTEQRHHCNHCSTTFSVTVQTVFHRSHLPLQKWFMALLLFLTFKQKITARQLAKILQINKNTASRLKACIRKAISDGKQRDFLLAVVERAEFQF
jgi:transposase-like protein